MKKTFALAHPRHKPAQAVALVKNRVRKYIKRERRKTLPDDVDFWDFDCRVGVDEDNAAPAHLAEVIKGIDAAVEAGSETVYVEILVKPGHRTKRPVAKDSATKEPPDVSDTGAV